MTWTIETAGRVVGTGDIPGGMRAVYSCSYQKGTVRQNDDAVLRLTELSGITVSKVVAYVRSNKSDGAGTWTVEVNGQTVFSKSGSFDQWFGAYDNSSYHALSLLPKSYANVQELSIRLHGTTNSLYISHYDITYIPAPMRTVTLMRGDEVYRTLTEVSSGAGVLLPEMDDYNGWQCFGWSETEWGQTTTRPAVLPVSQLYYPKTDCTLWAAYKASESGEDAYVTELENGVYYYTNSLTQMALAGTPEDGRMTPEIINLTDPWQQFSFTFNGAKDTAYIVHTATGTDIGYDNTKKMAVAPSPWRVYHNGDETVLYATIGNNNYILWLNLMDGFGEEFYAGLYAAQPKNSPMKLAYPAQGNETVYTCHPEFGMGFERNSEKQNNEYVFPFGCYELIIRNGEKELRMR